MKVNSVVIPCAGEGTRIHPYSESIPKPMLEVAGRPILEYILDRSLDMGCKHAVIIIGKFPEIIKNHFGNRYKHLTIDYISQEKRLGIGHALSLAEEFVTDQFAFLLGDELYIDANFTDMVNSFTSNDNAVIGLMKTTNQDIIKRNYTVSIEPNSGNISSLIEKPTKVNANILGVGTYLFNELIFEAIKVTSPSPRGEIEITDSINTLVKIYDNVKPFFLRGEYINIDLY